MSDAGTKGRAGQQLAASENASDNEVVQRELAAVVATLDTRYRTLGEMVVEVIREAIATGALAPGQRLQQETLASALGVSRIPVRSALMQLEAEGLVTFRPGRGAVVRSLTPDQVREIYEVRELLEVHALRKSMATMTPERLDRIRDLSQQTDAGADGGDFVDLRTALYREMYDGEHNPVLVKMIEELRGTVGRYLLGVRVSKRSPDRHRRLSDLVAAGDPDAAAEWLTRHLASVRDTVVALVSDADGPGGSATDPATVLTPIRDQTPARRNA